MKDEMKEKTAAFLKGIRSIALSFPLLMISVLLVFILLEIYLRVSGAYYIIRAGNELDYFGQFDSKLGWVNKPGAHGLMKHTGDIVYEISINQHGMRDGEYDIKKSSSARRIAVIGDSMTYGLGVSSDETYPKLIEKKLCRGFEVLNFGVSGFGLDQEFLYLQEKAILFNPDIVLCGFYVGNDFFETVSSQVGGYEKPLFRIRDDKLVLTNVPIPRKKILFYSTNGKASILIKKILRNKFYAYGFLVDRLKIITYQMRNKINKSDLSIKDITVKGRVIPIRGIYNPDDPANKGVYQLIEKIIREMDIFCKKKGSKFCLLIIPSYEQMENNNNFPQRMLSDFCLENGINSIDLLPFFIEARRQSQKDVYYKDDMHCTKYGHVVIADTFCDYLLKNNFLKK